jgi:hypothetical protein
MCVVMRLLGSVLCAVQPHCIVVREGCVVAVLYAGLFSCMCMCSATPLLYILREGLCSGCASCRPVLLRVWVHATAL